MTIEILKQFSQDPNPDNYVFGQVISIPMPGTLKIKTITGLEITVNDSNHYIIGDRVILARGFKDLSSLFIVRKIDIKYPVSENLIIPTGGG
jgi:hypothetical protein